MADVINLRRARKASAKNEKEKAAQKNRVVHGLSRFEKEHLKKMKALETSRLDGHKKGQKADQSPE